jgi:hypothetical protein
VVEKATPDDNLLTDPPSGWIEDIPLPVLAEFDCTSEFDGQGVVSDIFPTTYVSRGQYFRNLPNIAGFSALIPSNDENFLFENPGEINLYALQAIAKNPAVTINEILVSFISSKYNSIVVPFLKPAFEKAEEAILSSFYTLGLNTTNHSQLDFENRETYTINVPGRWIEPPVVNIGHGVNKEFHYWSDIVNHLAPVRFKQLDSTETKELSDVPLSDWLQPEELMDTTWLSYAMAEKEYGVRQAKEALAAVKSAKAYIHDSQKFNTLYHIFNRTLISAKLSKAYAQVYYGWRIWKRGEAFRNERLKKLIQQGINELEDVSTEMEQYSEKGPTGDYCWEKDARTARSLVAEVRKSGILPEKKL